MAKRLKGEFYIDMFTLSECQRFMHEGNASIIGDGGIVAICKFNEDPRFEILDRERRVKIEARKETYFGAETCCFQQ